MSLLSEMSDVQYSVSNGTVTSYQGTDVPHGLKKGNRFQVNDDNDNNLETLIVEDVSDTAINQFTAKSTILSGTNVDGHVLKHGLSANDEDTGKDDENLSVRGVPLYGLESARLTSNPVANSTTISLGSLVTGAQSGMGVRFPQGSYIQIDDEILRIASSTNSI